MKKFAIILSVLILAASTTIFAQGAGLSSKMGIGVNAGFHKLFGESEVEPTGFSPAGEFYAKYLFSDRINFSGGLGFGLINDGPLNNTFNTNLITADIKANINLLAPGKVNPYLSIGTGVFSWKFNAVETSPRNSNIPYPTNTWVDEKRYFDVPFIVGAGVEYNLNPKLAINVFADYRHTTSDMLDGFDMDGENSYVASTNDGFLNARAGVTYYLTPRGEATGSDEELLALESVDLGELGDFDDLGLPEASDEDLQMFEARLDKLEDSETGFSMEHYIRLKSRVDELNTMISEKESALEDLRTSLDLKDQRIADLESELERMGTGGYAGPVDVSDFSMGYEEALRVYYSRSFSNAANIFQQLKSSYPNHRLASNCEYWTGECQFGLGDYTGASNSFQNVLGYSSSYKRDDATLMLGRCYFQMNDMNSAKNYFEDVVNNYPDSEYVEKARMWLTRI